MTEPNQIHQSFIQENPELVSYNEEEDYDDPTYNPRMRRQMRGRQPPNTFQSMSYQPEPPQQQQYYVDQYGQTIYYPPQGYQRQVADYGYQVPTNKPAQLVPSRPYQSNTTSTMQSLPIITDNEAKANLPALPNITILTNNVVKNPIKEGKINIDKKDIDLDQVDQMKLDDLNFDFYRVKLDAAPDDDLDFSSATHAYYTSNVLERTKGLSKFQNNQINLITFLQKLNDLLLRLKLNVPSNIALLKMYKVVTFDKDAPNSQSFQDTYKRAVNRLFNKKGSFARKISGKQVNKSQALEYDYKKTIERVNSDNRGFLKKRLRNFRRQVVKVGKIFALVHAELTDSESRLLHWTNLMKTNYFKKTLDIFRDDLSKLYPGRPDTFSQKFIYSSMDSKSVIIHINTRIYLLNCLVMSDIAHKLFSINKFQEVFITKNLLDDIKKESEGKYTTLTVKMILDDFESKKTTLIDYAKIMSAKTTKVRSDITTLVLGLNLIDPSVLYECSYQDQQTKLDVLEDHLVLALSICKLADVMKTHHGLYADQIKNQAANFILKTDGKTMKLNQSKTMIESKSYKPFMNQKVEILKAMTDPTQEQIEEKTFEVKFNNAKSTSSRYSVARGALRFFYYIIGQLRSHLIRDSNFPKRSELDRSKIKVQKVQQSNTS